MRGYVVAAVLAASAMGAAEIRIDNLEAGEKVRYPLVLLRGAAKGDSLICGRDWSHMGHFPIVRGHFVALVELRPGANMVRLQCGNEVLKYRIDYKPMHTPYRVIAAYVTAGDEADGYQAPQGANPNQYREKLDTALKLLQCFTAEAMNDAGYGRKTFPLEFDNRGAVIVHVEKSEKDGQTLRAMDGNALWQYFNGILSKRYSYSTRRLCALMAFTRYDASTRKVTGHTALGGDGLGLFGSGSMYTWPSHLSEVMPAFYDARPIDPSLSFDDSGLRGTYWASTATTLGAVLHEMGHTFGLPHSVDPYCIMSRGFDHINRMFTLFEPPANGKRDVTFFSSSEVARWDPFFAARLAWNKWFQPEAVEPAAQADPPSITLDPGSGDVVFTAACGLRVIGAEADDHPSEFQVFKNQPPKTVRLKQAGLKKKLGIDKVSYYAEDDAGNEARLTP